MLPHPSDVKQDGTPLTVGVDIGGTKVLAGAVDAAGTILSVVRTETPHRSKSPEVVETTIVAAVRELLCERQAVAVGVGAAGFVDASGSTVVFSPHLAWRNEPLRAGLEARLDLPVTLDNDANTTAHAESRFGAGRGYAHVLCLTLGTGIGGALVVGGQLFRGGHGMAGEFGHMQVVAAGRRCECGNRGCWEQYCSGNALVRDARELLASGSPAGRVLREAVHDNAGPLTGQMVTEAARAGDDAAIELFRGVGSWLGAGVSNLVSAFDPEVVVVGGGLAQAGDLLLDPAREVLARTLPGRGYRPEPPIVPAQLGVDAGFVGAADLARGLVR